jgi:chromosome transmission fidelity protein 8
MPSVVLYPPQRGSPQNGTTTTPANPVPHLLQTPSGLALLEIQGTLHTPIPDFDSDKSDLVLTETQVGRLVFPLYNPESPDHEHQSWMKRVYLYVGKHQRLTGEVKKLPKAIAVIRKCDVEATGTTGLDGNEPLFESERSAREQLEIVEIVKYKILFASRPEPVGD